MAGRRPGPIHRVLRGLRGKTNRFRQVQRSLRKDSDIRLPIALYGRSDILTKDQWRKIIDKYNSQDLLETLNKLDQKIRLTEAGVIVPENYLVMESEEDLDRFGEWLKGQSIGFALKPSSGHGGSGIKVIEKRVAGRFITISGKGLGIDDITRHAGKILKGNFTRGEPDHAIVERRLILHKSLRELLTPGLLDIRIVVFRGFPLMAMTRLPTRRSIGKANIHQGAIGAGISLSEGRITSATLFRRSVKCHPSSGKQVVGFRFNMWEEILETASMAAEASGFGFVGVDLTMDRDLGVVVLEVNKRPGLEIQNANRSGLRRRIRWVETRINKDGSDLLAQGPGIKAELSRKWDIAGWRKFKDQLTEE